MIFKNSCSICQHVQIKKNFWGKTKYVCANRSCKVDGTDICPIFVRDVHKVLQCAGYRDHEYGSPDCCNYCEHLKSEQNGKKFSYSCSKHGIKFSDGFDGLEHICDFFLESKSASMDRLCELVLEQEWEKEKLD